MTSCHHHSHHGPKGELPPIGKGMVLLRNCNVFDGVNEALLQGQDVLVEKNLISKVVPTGSETFDVADDGVVLDCEGRTLMPGLIDCHWHSVLSAVSVQEALTKDLAYLGIKAGSVAGDTLLRGFTTCRDMGATPFGIKEATDEGIIKGPRLYNTGPFISQTAGHFDYRSATAVPTNPNEPLDYLQRAGVLLIADGVPEMLKRTREVLRMGATQVKIAGGGGVNSLFDALDVAEFTYDEVKAAVDCANAWNTYVGAHVFTEAGIKTCVEAGVKSIEHGFLATRESLQLMKDNDVWFCYQPFLDDEDALPYPPGSEQEAKFKAVANNAVEVTRLAREIGVKMAWGTDVFVDPELLRKQGKMLAKMTTKLGFSAYESLKMATSTNAELVKMCNQRDPYPHPLGVVKEGAYADLILVDGNPLEDITLVANPWDNFVAIMKDGEFAKNTLE